MKKKRSAGYGPISDTQVPAFTLFEVLPSEVSIGKREVPFKVSDRPQTPIGHRPSMEGVADAPTKKDPFLKA